MEKKNKEPHEQIMPKEVSLKGDYTRQTPFGATVGEQEITRALSLPENGPA